MSTAARRCPSCDKPVPADAGQGPFCSKRCRLIDLGRWFNEEYVVPGEDAVAFDGLAPPVEDAGDDDRR